MDEVSSFLLSVIESSDDAIIGLNKQGDIVSCNPATEKTYGYSGKELIGEQITKLSLPDRIKEISLILLRTFNGERVAHFQTILLRKNGTTIPVSLSISPVTDKHDLIVGASFIARDLSRHFTFEKTLRETERRYQQLKSSLELAHEVQETLLPSINNMTFPELDVYAKTLYSEDVGGDYFDFYYPETVSRNILGIAVGDVSGHGTSAALLMAMVKGALQTEAEHSQDNLEKIMDRLNKFFSRHAENGLLMTLFLGVVDVRLRSIKWCSAGQGPVYIYHTNGQCFEELSCTGSPLGALDEMKNECQSSKFREGDILIVGTDGIWEALSPAGEMFSVERFRQLLATWHQKSSKEICTRMLARVKQFTAQDKLYDDTSLMIIKFPVVIN